MPIIRLIAEKSRASVFEAKAKGLCRELGVEAFSAPSGAVAAALSRSSYSIRPRRTVSISKYKASLRQSCREYRSRVRRSYSGRSAAYTGLDVRHMTFADMTWAEEFDGIWACATLLHVPRDELGSTFARIARALRRGGAWYLSVKYGIDDRVVGECTFTDMTEQEMQNRLEDRASL